MKKQLFLIGFIAVFIAEIIALIVFAVQTPDFSQDTVAVNEVVQTVTRDFNSLKEHKNKNTLDYVVLNNDGELNIENGAHGLKVTVRLCLNAKN